MSGFYGKMELILGTKIIDIAVQVANLVVFNLLVVVPKLQCCDWFISVVFLNLKGDHKSFA